MLADRLDVADRLSTQSLEALRDRYHWSDTGLILIGMPGFETRLAPYPQLSYRIGFTRVIRIPSP